MEKIKEKLAQYVETACADYDLPGLVVAVKMSEEWQWKKAVGYQNFITKKPLKAEHIFHMASVSKLFTACAVLTLREEGRLQLEDSLAKVLPSVKIADKRYEEITLGHMLCHTSGMDDVKDYHWDTPRLDDKALQDYAHSAEVKDSHMLWSPRENKFRYSNMAYELLGLVVETRAEMPYEEYIRTKFLLPLGMENATFLTPERTGGSLALDDLEKAGVAMPHNKDEENHIQWEKHMPYNRQHAPSSTLTCNVADLLQWGTAHINQTLFPPAVYQEMWKPYTLIPNNGEHMGLGWFIREQGGHTFYGHEGTDDGYRASFWLCPSLKMQVAVCSNLRGAPVKRINKKICQMLIETQ